MFSSKEWHVREAETLQREMLATQLRVLENPRTWASQGKLARTLLTEGHYAEAEELARASYERQIRTLGPQNHHTWVSIRVLGRALAYQHRYSEASKLFRDVIEKGGNSAGSYLLWYDFACAAAAANRPDDALNYLQEAINRGYKDADGLMADYDLKNLRPNPKFQQLVAELKHPSAKDQKAQTQEARRTDPG
jgi:eukaryotic-like serine/threonine-protein kinase